MLKNETYIGVDLGGTNIRVALVNRDGEILQLVKDKTEIENGRDKVFQKIVTMMKSLNLSECVAAGIGVPGIIDDKKGIMKFANNLKGFENFSIIDELRKEFDFPLYLLNDVAAAGIAEAYFGSAKDFSSIVYITISTGIGSAIIIDNHLINGSNGYAGEIGNMITSVEREKIGNSAPGSLETEASGSALVRKARASLANYSSNSAKELFAEASKGNPIADKIVNDFISDMAQITSGVAHVIDPEVFVFGGGVMKSKEFFFSKLIKKHHSFVYEGMSSVQFIEASFDEPGVLGAASYAMSKTKVD